MNSGNVRTFLPFDTDDITVIALHDGRVATQAGRALFHFTPTEAVSLGDCLIKAGILSAGTVLRSAVYEEGRQHGRTEAGALPYSPTQLMDIAVAATSDRGPIVADAMVDRAIAAWEAWWTDYAKTAGTTTAEANRSCLQHVLREALGGAA